MQSEIDLLRQCIVELEAELETKNSEISELRKRLAEFEARDVEIHELRKKVAEVEAKNAELIKQMMKENNRRNARIEDLEKNKMDRVTKLEQKQLQNDSTPNNSISNFNSSVVHPEKSLEDKEMDIFLVNINKKSIGENIRRNNREKKLQHESAIQDVISKQSCEIETVDVENSSDGSGLKLLMKVTVLLPRNYLAKQR